jgi:hypothetical protein
MKKAILRRSLIAALLPLACACGSNTTTGKEVKLETELVSDPEIKQAFATETGWKVKLGKAAVSVGALYYFEGEPAFVMNDRRSFFEQLAALASPLSSARAHPGHYVAGMAMGQMISPFSADLLSGSTRLPAGIGITGLYRSARFVFATPAAGPALAELGNNVAIAEGVATKADKTVHFKLSASFAEVAKSVAMGQVAGCEFAEDEIDSEGTVTVTIKPHIWFNLVDFSDVAPGSAHKPTEIAASETAHIAFALGLVQLSAYHFAYEP